MKLNIFCLAAAVPAILFWGCSKKETAPVPPPVAAFDLVVLNINPTDVVCENKSTNGISYQWDFGDGSTDTVQSPVHSYRIPAVYTIKLTVKNVSGSSTISKSVTIQAPTKVSFGAVRLNSFPLLDPSCNCGWDPTSAPDIYFRFSDNANNLIATGKTYSDATSANLPLLWNYAGGSYMPELPYLVTDLNKIYKFSVYDADAPPSDPDDLMAEFSLNFAAYAAAANYPDTIRLNLPSSSGPLTMQLVCHWEK